MISDAAKLIGEICGREGCCLTDVGGVATLLGWSLTYDKNGIPSGEDPNSYTNQFVCQTCGDR